MSIYANITNRKPIYRGIYWGIYGQDSDPLVFHALTHAGASGGVDAAGNTLLPYEGTDTLVATVAGLTEARTSTNYAPDHEGVWRSWGSGEAVREGWRQVRNYAMDTDELDAATWSSGSTLIITAGATDPLGGSTAYTLKNTLGGTQIFRDTGVISDTSVQVCFSCWVRRRTGTGTVRMYTGASASDVTDITALITTSWKRIAATVATPDGGGSERIGFFLTTLNDEIDIWHPQLEDVTGQTNQAPAEYVENTASSGYATKYFASTNPWEVTSNIATATATVTPLTDVWTVGSPAHTNSLPYSLPDTTNWSLTEGSSGDLVTNGGFDTDTDWTKGTGWSIAAGVASCDGTQNPSSSSLSQSLSGTSSGVVYKVTFTVSGYSAGTVRSRMGASVQGDTRSANGTYTDYLTADSTPETIEIRADADFIGDIDNVIVQPCVISSYTTGLTGAADSAVVLTDDDGSIAEYVEETFTTTASQIDVARFFVKKDTDETRFPAVQMYNDATHYLLLSINTKTGASSAITNNGTNDYEVRDTGHGWWEVLLSVTTADSASNIRVYPAYGTALGVGSAAATGSVTIADPVELHLNTTIAAVRGSSPIFTSGSAASTVASAMSFSDQNHSDDQGLWSCEIKNVGIDENASLDCGIIGLGALGRVIYTDSTFKTYEGTTTANGTAVTLAPDDTEYKVAVAYGSSLMRVATDGLLGTAAAYDGSYDNTASKIKVLAHPNFVDDMQQVVLIKDIRRYNLPYASAVTKAEEVTS